MENMTFYLFEINRDHSKEFVPYTPEDVLTGWFEWCEGQYYQLKK